MFGKSARKRSKTFDVCRGRHEQREIPRTREYRFEDWRKYFSETQRIARYRRGETEKIIRTDGRLTRHYSANFAIQWRLSRKIPTHIFGGPQRPFVLPARRSFGLFLRYDFRVKCVLERAWRYPISDDFRAKKITLYVHHNVCKYICITCSIVPRLGCDIKFKSNAQNGVIQQRRIIFVNKVERMTRITVERLKSIKLSAIDESEDLTRLYIFQLININTRQTA